MVHSINTTIYSILIAIKSGLPTHELKELAEGALLHDLGKIILNESILLKSSALTQEEFNHISCILPLAMKHWRKSICFPMLPALSSCSTMKDWMAADILTV